MESSGIRVLERAVDILDTIQKNGGKAGISVISRQTGLAKSTVFRILDTLVGTGYVRRDTDQDQYALGYRLIELSFTAVGRWEVVSLAMPYLEQLKEELKETAALALRAGIQYSFVAQATCLHEYRVNAVPGERYYLHWAGTGKAMLAFAPAADQEKIMRILPGASATEKTIRDEQTLKAQIKEIKKYGYAYSFSERIEGGASFSAPILGADRIANAAVSLIGPEVRLRKMDPEKTGKILVETANQLSQIYQNAGISLETCV